MNSFLYRIRCSVARFMYGRNGFDQLGMAVLVLEGFCYLGSAILRRGIAGAMLHLLSLLLAAILLFRLFSRNLEKRRSENTKFLYWFGPRLGGLRDWYSRCSDREHRYVKCACGAWCRVPRGIGRIELICPRCSTKQIINT